MPLVSSQFTVCKEVQLAPAHPAVSALPHVSWLSCCRAVSISPSPGFTPPPPASNNSNAGELTDACRHCSLRVHDLHRRVLSLLVVVRAAASAAECNMQQEKSCHYCTFIIGQDPKQTCSPNCTGWFLLAGAIIGGILGTLAALTLLAGIAALIAWCRRRRIRKNNPFSDASAKKQPQQQPHQRPAWLEKLPGFGKKHPQDGVIVYKNPVYAPKGSPGPRPGPGPYANGRAGPHGGPGGPGPYANARSGPGGPGGPGPYVSGTPGYHRSLSDPGGAGGQFYGYPAQGSAGRSGSRGGQIPPAAYGPPAVVPGGPGRGAAAFGYGADELQDCLKDLKYVVTNRLLPAVDNASLITGEQGVPCS